MKAREALSEETDIMEIIKSIRYFNEALKHLLPGDIRRTLKDRGEFVIIDSDLDDKTEKEAFVPPLGLKQADSKVSPGSVNQVPQIETTIFN